MTICQQESKETSQTADHPLSTSFGEPLDAEVGKPFSQRLAVKGDQIDTVRVAPGFQTKKVPPITLKGIFGQSFFHLKEEKIFLDEISFHFSLASLKHRPRYRTEFYHFID
jgi:hypothetical protein